MSCDNVLSVDNDEYDRNTSLANQVQVSNTYKQLNIKRTVDVRKSTGSFIFHNGVISSRIRFVNDYHEEYISVATSERLKSICKSTDTLVTGISSNFLLNRNIKNKKKSFGKIKTKNMPMKANKNYFETTKIEQRLTTNQLPKGQDSVNVLDDTDSVICLGILDVASSKISTNKTSEKYDQNSSLVLSNSNNLNENDVIIVQQYCNLCGEDLNMEYNQISDKHRCPDSARNCQKRTKLTKSICSIETKKTSKIRNSGQDNTTTTTTSGLSSITSLPLNIESCNKNNENPVVIQDTTCNTSTNSLFFNDNNIINALKRKVSEFLDKKYTQTGDATSTSYGNNNKCLCQNFVNLNLKKTNDVESRHKLRVNSESTEVVDDKFEQGCIDNARDNYIFGYNYYGSKVRKKSGLRLIVIDGSNVALGHSKGKFFSSEGLKICIEYFYQRGHEVKAFVPQFRLKNGQTSNKQLLQWLYNRGWVIFTPSREVNGRMIVPYDDRFIVQCAALHDAVIVSNDCYRDLMKENPQWKKTIENNLLMVTWVDDVIYFPTDPLGKRGPTLESFLRYS